MNGENPEMEDTFQVQRKFAVFILIYFLFVFVMANLLIHISAMCKPNALLCGLQFFWKENKEERRDPINVFQFSMTLDSVCIMYAY